MSHSFNPKERSLRKQWLVLSIISILIWPLVTLGMLAFIAEKEAIPANAFTYIATGVVLTLALFYFLYRCAYVKPGIRFLTFVLIVGPIVKLKGVVDVLRADHNTTALVSLALNLAIYAWWYYLSLKLRKMNQSHKH